MSASSPSRTTSSVPGMFVTTEGTPTESASRSAFGSPSAAEGRTKTEAALRSSGTSFRTPRNETRSASPSSRASARRAVSSGPQPAHASRASGTRSKTFAKARMRTWIRFCGSCLPRKTIQRPGPSSALGPSGENVLVSTPFLTTRQRSLGSDASSTSARTCFERQA